MKDNRPVNLALQTMKFPITAIVSITHRVTGLLLFFLIPLSLWVLDVSLNAPDSFDQVMQLLHSGWGKFLTWAFLSALLFHLVMGIRHLLMDFGYGETLQGGKIAAWISIVISVVVIVLAGVWIW